MNQPIDQAADAQAKGQQFGIQKIFTKDVSFECPNAPQVFRKEWKPEVNVELGNEASNIANNTYEVVLTVTVTVKIPDMTAYLCEIKQAGIFYVEGFEQQPLDGLLGSYCPNILFPFAREVVADLVQRSGFPPFYLQPVNFDAIYAQQKQQQGEDQPEPKTKH